LPNNWNNSATLKQDLKLSFAELILDDWLNSGLNPVIFCRYIATAKYVGEQLAPALKKKFPKLDLRVITSELPDKLRKQRIEEMGKSPLRVLVADSCRKAMMSGTIWQERGRKGSLASARNDPAPLRKASRAESYSRRAELVSTRSAAACSIPTVE